MSQPSLVFRSTPWLLTHAINPFYREQHIFFSFFHTPLWLPKKKKKSLQLFFFSLFATRVKPEALSLVFEIKQKERHYLRRLFLNLCEGSASNRNAFAMV
jgi:hypothetical protein